MKSALARSLARSLTQSLTQSNGTLTIPPARHSLCGPTRLVLGSVLLCPVCPSRCAAYLLSSCTRPVFLARLVHSLNADRHCSRAPISTLEALLLSASDRGCVSGASPCCPHTPLVSRTLEGRLRRVEEGDVHSKAAGEMRSNPIQA